MMYPSVDPVNVQRMVTFFGVKTQKSPDDPVSPEVLVRRCVLRAGMKATLIG